MLIFGHSRLKSELFYHIHDTNSISKTPPSSILFIDFSEKNFDIIEYMKLNDLDFALEVNSLKDAIFSEQLGAKYIITDTKLAKTIQDRAEYYLFDAKILCRIEDESEIEALAKEGIDGVIFAEAIIKII